MDDVQEDIASLGVRNWKTMASDRVQWRAVIEKPRFILNCTAKKKNKYLFCKL